MDDALRNRRVTVMGLGRFGGGLGAAQWLASQGARVVVTDMQPAEKLAEPLAELRALIERGAVVPHLGGHDRDDFINTDLVVVNPAVPAPWSNQFLDAARAAGVPMTTEMGLLVERAAARLGRDQTIAVTGSVGKSTTTAMIAHALRALGQTVLLGGNIGGSLLSTIDSVNPESKPWLVLELSSFMLHHLGMQQQWSPRIAVVTNLSANHIDWHGTMDHYRASKQQILAHQRAGDIAVLGPGVEDWPVAAGVRVARTAGSHFGETLTLPGEHNRVNAAQAATVIELALLTVPRSEIERAIGGFGGLIHRLQLVAEVCGVKFFNDSKSTTPEAAIKAVEALEKPSGSGREAPRSHIHLIAGGYARGTDLSPVADLTKDLAGLYTIGQTGPVLTALARAIAPTRVHSFETLEPALRAAAAAAKPGDCVLLSPACASWDQFTNYEARGELFVALVGALSGAKSAPMAIGGGVAV